MLRVNCLAEFGELVFPLSDWFKIAVSLGKSV
jgi:hypothetical protein